MKLNIHFILNSEVMFWQFFQLFIAKEKQQPKKQINHQFVTEVVSEVICICFVLVIMR